MKTVVVETEDASIIKLLLELAKRMGLKARVEKNKEPKKKEKLTKKEKKKSSGKSKKR